MSTRQKLPQGVEIDAPLSAQQSTVVSAPALAFIAKLVRKFEPRRRELMAARAERQAGFDAGGKPDFLAETKAVRDAEWTVGAVPHDLQDRRVEITGPTDRKMVINALNSGANVFMADFEDSNAPTWENMVEGQVNLRDAVNRTIEYRSPDGRHYQLGEKPATLIV